MNPFTAPIAEQIWDAKYRLKAADGTPIDQTWDDTVWRVSRHLASAEPFEEQGKWSVAFHDIMADFSFIPAGRIIAGAGAGRNVTLSNCFTMGTIPDSMAGIFTHLREAAVTMQAGGGIGYDFSTIRPRGAAVKGVGAEASGPLSFMDCWDAMCRTVMSAGSRRGAMMATMRCDHPDIEAFIEAKSDPARLRMFNVSVLVTDAFMEAVEADKPWELVHKAPPIVEGKTRTDSRGLSEHVYKVVSARALWDKILRSTYDYAEPGVLFIDRINRLDNMGYAGTIATTNPCGEEPMQPYESCLLGSINLARFVIDPYDHPSFDFTRMKSVVRTAVRMLDNVVDVNRYPLEAQAEITRKRRRIGLGITGLADALLMMGIRYGSDLAVEWTRSLMQVIAEEAYRTSQDLAIEKGPFPDFRSDGYYREGSFADRVFCMTDLGPYPTRNALLLSIAPTGTISLVAGNVSSGGEPIYAPSFNRKVLQPDGSKTEEVVVDYAVREWNVYKLEKGVYDDSGPLPPAYVDAQTLTPAEHVKMQAALQEWVDASISKTVNVRRDISFEDFKEVYKLAWDSGCKGCTTYRPNDVTGSILSVEPAPAAPEPAPQPEAPVSAPAAPFERPMVLCGDVTKVKLREHALYVTVTDIEDEDGRRPFELFLNTKDPQHHAWATAVSRTVSAVFRRGGDTRFIADELKAVHDPAGGGWWNGRYWPSEVAAVGQVIEDHYKRLESGVRVTYLEVPTVSPEAPAPASVYDDIAKEVFRPAFAQACPKCLSYRLKHESGCTQCLDCGHSSCG